MTREKGINGTIRAGQKRGQGFVDGCCFFYLGGGRSILASDLTETKFVSRGSLEPSFSDPTEAAAEYASFDPFDLNSLAAGADILAAAHNDDEDDVLFGDVASLDII